MKILKWSSFPVLVLLIVMAVINSIITPGFLSLSSLSGFFGSYAPLVCVAIGSAVVLFGGGIDISLGAIVSLVNVVLITLVGKGFDMFSASVIALLVAVAMGALNGFVIGFLRVNPLLITFSTSSVAAGLALWVMPTPGGQASMNFITWYNGNWFGIPTPIYFIVFVWLLWYLLSQTPIGIWLYAMGRDERKAFVSAISVSWLQFFTYVFAAFVTGIGAIALTGSIGSGDPLVGLPISLNAIAACVIGGISLMGGSGDSLGAIFGALFLGLVSTTVLAVHIPPFYQDLVSGVIVLFGIIGSISLLRKFKFDA
ncbi:ABC transporter permease [Thermoactinomyces sp. CICC 10522]|uniref:ABC transporter permease n=1 Tax=Thermoactinomyces sp. CICC 10522 TaxID=2767427 RepID=UPI0018DEAD61|nr:ABC transporter permease [Thermoactinomyces sp. CICC 10522]MBH8605481.1 ABC transporter permease [Thermoactinomyces sp. CICC 10522]